VWGVGVSDTLHLTLYKKWFELMLSGEKNIEYRERKAYWYAKLGEGRWKRYDKVKFVNGYGSNRPWMIRELLTVDFLIFDGLECYAIFLGKILKKGNIKLVEEGLL